MSLRHTLPPTLVVASVRRRLGAFLADGVIVATAGYLVAAVLGSAIGPATEVVTEDDVARVVLHAGRHIAQAVAVMLLSGIYFIVSWSRWSATPSQRLLGVRVLDVETTQPLRPDRSLARWVVLGGPLGTLAALTIEAPILWTLVATVAVVLTIVLLISTVRNSARRGIHDRVARSIVVSAVRLLEQQPEEAGAHELQEREATAAQRQPSGDDEERGRADLEQQIGASGLRWSRRPMA